VENSAAIVQTRDLTVKFGRRNALQAISMAVPYGITGVLGPNGAGKTTLLAVLATAVRIPAGAAWIGGHDLGTGSGRRAARELIGWLPQRFDLAGGMTAIDTVAYAAWANGIPAEAAVSHANEALQVVDLGGRAKDRVRQLSGGQRQRLGLAASIAHRPAVLLLDEPTSGLDPEQRRRFKASLEAATLDRTVLFASHLHEDLALIARQIAVLDEGGLVFMGTPQELTEFGEGSLKVGSKEAVTVNEFGEGYMRVLLSRGGRRPEG
jgi:ABC-2 type transport system ATP-binding protein